MGLSPWHPSAPARKVSALSEQIGTNDSGNGRADVGRYGGLMVRRCEAVAFYAIDDAKVPALRTAVHNAAARARVTVRDVPAEVLSPATLEKRVPDVVECLPDGSTKADAVRLLAATVPGAESRSSESVLVHELRFVAPPGQLNSAPALAAAVNREGILSDILGGYQVEPKDPSGALSIRYVGTLLSAFEIDEVRAALVRQAGTSADTVTVTPLSWVGVGVDVAKEPPPAPATESPGSADHTGH